MPDYFSGEVINGVVTKATFSKDEGHPQLVIDYNVGSEKFHYTTEMWFLTNYKVGEKVPVNYNPDKPSVACIYAFIGYWIKWPELAFTAGFFIVLFLASVSITGKNDTSPITEAEKRKKRKYDD